MKKILFGGLSLVAMASFAVTTPTIDPTAYAVSAVPKSVLMSFYDGPDTRGFAWETDTTVSETKLWLIEGSHTSAEAALFDAATPAEGTYIDRTQGSSPAKTVRCHKAHVSGLVSGKTYSYRVGGSGNYVYGTFAVDTSDRPLTILYVGDQQVKTRDTWYVWENTMQRAAEVLPSADTDLIISGGDIFNLNTFTYNYLMWGVTIDLATPYYPGVPWTLASGNHDPDRSGYTYYADLTGVNYQTPNCHSYDYGAAHFVILPFRTSQAIENYTDVAAWAEADLKAANAAGKTKWNIVMMHWGPYTTGDHGVEDTTPALVELFCPIFSSNRVDLVLQAHDHTYSKTLPYKWNTVGYTTSRTDAAIVNTDPTQTTIGGKAYDLNPEGTYYIATGCSGPRIYEGEGKYAYIGAEKSYDNRNYKIVTGKIALDSAYGNAGDDGSSELQAAMFGVLKVDDSTLTYDWYVVNSNGLESAVLYDTLRVAKGNTFRVTPYVQHPTTNAVSLLWLAQTNGNASVSWWEQGGATTNTIASATEIAPTDRVANSRFTAEGVLQYCLAPEFGYDQSPESGDNYPTYTREGVGKNKEGAGWSMPYTVPYQYRVRLTGLKPDTVYGYRVTLASGVSYERTFRTSPAAWRPIRFAYYSDSETEPADNPLSTGRTSDWTSQADPTKTRTYYATQTEAYATNVARVVEFDPDLIVMAGDLAQKGSRQLDWDEFWRHNAGLLNDPAGSRPILASPGNHDYWSYNDGGEAGMKKYLSYFEFEPNGTSVDADIQERFHRVDYGVATFLFMDANNGDDSDSTKDTNLYMSRTTDYPGLSSSCCRAPDFHEGSPQYQWLETQLADAQQKSAFIFVVCHQCPYSVGDHGQPNGTGGERLSGRPLRVLETLFHKYGVTAWLCGHDEMMERSTVTGTETCLDGTTREHTLQIWDMGIAGDGLRGGMKIANPQEQYRAYVNSIEQYDAQGVQTDGGVHYGHLEVTITNRADGAWVATFDPVYEFFTTNAAGQAVFGGTRHYDDLLSVVYTNSIRASVHHTAKATGPGGLLRFGDGTAAAEVACDSAVAVTLTALPQSGYQFYRWIGDTDGMDEATVTSASITLDPAKGCNYRAVFLRTTGTGTATFVDPPTDGASWFDAANWVGGELPVAGDAVTIEPSSADSKQKQYKLILDAPTPRYSSVLINHANAGGCVLMMTNWTTRLEADTITLGGLGAMTCAGPFGEDEMSNRVWIVCNDFTMKKSSRVKINNVTWTSFGYLDVDDKGYKVSCGPGTCNFGASHGGTGATKSNVKLSKLPALPYDSAELPQMPGSGGSKSGSKVGTAGGGAIRIDATGIVTVENNNNSAYPNRITASASTKNSSYGIGSGSGGSICITCRRFVCGRANILATGGDGYGNWNGPEHNFDITLPGGGGRIAIRYDASAQQPGDVANTVLSAAGGTHCEQWKNGVEPSNWRSPTVADRFRQDADLGTVWLTDTTLLGDVLSKGLSGSVAHPVAPTFENLTLDSGFVRFPLDGETMSIAGNLCVSGALTRLEFGGSFSTNWLVTGTMLRTKTPWKLNVGGDLLLGEGARLDVHPAMATNATLAAGAVVQVVGALSLGGYTNRYATVSSSTYAVSNTSLVVWNDGYTGVAPRFEVGSLAVESNALITSYRRGYLAGGELTDAGVTDFPCYGFGPVVSNRVVGTTTNYWYGGGDSSDSGNNYGGGGHGGAGGFRYESGDENRRSTYRGQVYDDELKPTMAGSGGGARYYGVSTLPGGGAIRVVAQESILVDGVICADAASYIQSYNGTAAGIGAGGAGAGGSILLECREFSGKGILSANGGQINSTGSNKNYGCGGGGRIAVWTGEELEKDRRLRRSWISDSPRLGSVLFTGTATAAGGISDYGETRPSLNGEDGTVRFVNVPDRYGTVILVR